MKRFPLAFFTLPIPIDDAKAPPPPDARTTPPAPKDEPPRPRSTN